MPDIVTDGIFNPKKLVEGRLPSDFALCVIRNEGARFVNLGLAAMLQGGTPEVSLDIGPFTCEREPLMEIRFPAVQ